MFNVSAIGIESTQRITNQRQLGKIFHYTVDLVLISIILAALRKNTGLSLTASDLSSSNDGQTYIKKYLGFGEYSYNLLVSFARRSRWFKQRPIRDTNDLRDRIKQEVNGFIDDTSK
ncbi:Hypothetical protein PAS_chr1-1_0205 [Komagataella phaffii GS115]|uniref:DUF1748-domain-containing protein n=1 Tax=Komagataella phaffii (strain GS115 / ATCC 20864) TaxID=644223 RepID=C4QWF0_KOMPG|nr:Hypothetical protein PAS_chr1-1_0205 [Komagataella phaffii GS115]CAY67573.1 Hypothetical protein PAS_chr1-1_0205 [Komagataella phaffii GS115]